MYHLYTTGQNDVNLLIYPPVEGKLTTSFGALVEMIEGPFARYTGSIPPREVPIDWELLDERRAVVRFPTSILAGVHDVILQIDYAGDVGNAYIDGKLVHDHFYNGQPWKIGLRHLSLTGETEMVIVISPIKKHTGGVRYIPTGMAFRPDSGSEALAAIRSIRAVPEYKILVGMVPDS